MRKAWLMLLWLLLPAWAQAAIPPELTPFLQRSTAYGQAEMRVLWMEVYAIALWTDAPRWRPDAPYALSIRYRMDFTSEELVGRTCEEIARHHAQGEAWCVARAAQLRQAMPSVASGDRITALRTAEGHAHFFKNGTPTAQIEDRAFADAFFAIWLGERTSEPEMRAQLVGAS